ncbi:MAG: acyl-CoA carboxylase subunit beta, partial [bacterium]|nr:acyl-CoA carboxylase subunit beta [bacterium]
MPVLPTKIDRSSPEFRANRESMVATLAGFEELMAQAREGGGPKYVRRHLARGKLLARQRIELLVDRDSPFMELSTLACWGTGKTLGGNLITG